MAVVMYRRVSSVDQNLDRQEVAADVDRTFEDKASGKDRNRPGLDACLAYVREGDTLRVHSADRLARSLADLLHLLDDLTSRGVTVQLVKEGMTFDPGASDPYQRCMLSMLGAFAELERDIIAARAAEGIALAKARGGVFKGRAMSLTPQQVRAARQRRADGVTLARLIKDHGVSKITMQKALAGVGPYGEGDYR